MDPDERGMLAECMEPVKFNADESIIVQGATHDQPIHGDDASAMYIVGECGACLHACMLCGGSASRCSMVA
jgi:hypothetical protein